MRYILCFLIFAAPLQPVSADILAGPFVNPANGHTYFLLTNANWTASKEEAVNLGGNLVTINDNQENEWVFNSFASWGGIDRLLWIGLNDVNKPLDFTWSSGQKVTYLNWSSGEPNNPNVENFTLMYCNNVPSYATPRAWNNFRDESSDIGLNIFGVVEIESSVLLGDINGDSEVNLLDVQPFVVLLQNSGYQDEADINQDGVVDLLDVQPFVDVLSGG